MASGARKTKGPAFQTVPLQKEKEMAFSPETTVRIPVTARYRIIDGKPVMIEAEYKDIPASVIAKMILTAFGVPIREPGKDTVQ